MAQPRILVLRAPGTNCDWETQFAFEQSGAACERIHINRVIDNPAMLTVDKAIDAYSTVEGAAGESCASCHGGGGAGGIAPYALTEQGSGDFVASVGVE